MPRTNVDQVATEYRHFNDWIRGERKVKKITQKAMADYIGISQGQLSKRENGEVEWELRECFKALECLGIDIRGILGLSPNG